MLTYNRSCCNARRGHSLHECEIYPSNKISIDEINTNNLKIPKRNLLCHMPNLEAIYPT